MKKKGIVEEVEEKSGRTIWKLTEKGKQERIGGYELDEIDELFSIAEVEEIGISISNIVGSFGIGRTLDLTALSSDLPNSEYHPESNSSLVYRLPGENNITILVHTSGRQSITGAKNKLEVRDAYKKFINSLENIGVRIEKENENIIVQNIVATYDFKREFDLAALSVTLGLEDVEYEPEQFPGVIYRSETGATVLLFSSGKCVITGAKTYAQVVDALRELEQKFNTS
jgi:transcription initiation factor TFIID TATA-box-binding protein